MTEKQRQFVGHYLSNGFNATQAAISAGYSKKTAKSMGSENLSKPDVRDALELAKLKCVEKIELNKEQVLKHIKDRAFVKGDKDQLKALELLGKYFGLFDGRQGVALRDRGASTERIQEALGKVKK